jgi:hypothetical protein
MSSNDVSNSELPANERLKRLTEQAELWAIKTTVIAGR